ncbi:6-bladed beta-propeller protein [Mucilaginibacter pineti]|uniref:6-bladed beta-propeller protein n=2 Tax=Mucilaginibacter pineti TaxID=1391627 RepID=A0A1G7F1S1_9SPHI|nr:6-bladed beta-propeller protein [Mucilaginibacter pineti]
MRNLNLKNAAIMGCLFFISIAAAAQEPTHPQEIYIDPNSVTNVTKQQVFDEVNYIPLQTIAQSRFNTIDQLVVTDKYFIINEQKTNHVLLFDKTGKFHCKIEVPSFSTAFSVNRQKREIMVKKGRTEIYYNFDGKKLREQPEKSIGTPYYFANGRIGYADYRVSEQYLPDTVNHEYRLYSKGRQYAGYLPYNMKLASIQNSDDIYTWHGPFFDIGSSKAVLYCRPFEYNIYELTSQRAYVKYKLVLPQEYVFPQDVLTVDSLKGHRYTYFNANQKQIREVSFAYETGNNIFFRLNSSIAGTNGSISYIYNLKTNALAAIKDIYPDATNYNLPITDIYNGGNFYNRNFLTSDGTYVYTSIKAELMFATAAKAQNQYPNNLKQYFAKGSSNGNPVIVQIKAKDQFTIPKAELSSNK